MPATPRGATLRRRIRSTGGKVIRRFGLLPAGTPDGLGEDAALLGTSWPYEVLVYFADTTEALYQIEQWYDALRALHAEHPVVVVTRDSRTTRAIRRDSGLDVRTVAHYTTLDDVLGRSATKLALYVNHNPENFSCLRFGNLVHASLMHGDSDKLVTVSNQTKAYDFSFVAGQAAVERMARFSTLYDAHARCVTVGRPQLDDQLRLRATTPRGPLPTVLYAPTWEGGQPSAEYGSVATHGPRIVRALVESGRYRVLYRPHPLTGVRVAAYGDADAAIREYLASAPAPAEGAAHGTDTHRELAPAFAAADLLVCDVSGVAMDWLATGEPIVVTRPVGDAVIATSPLLELAPALRVDDLDDVAGLVERELTEDPTRAERLRLRDHYLGDTEPGAATRRFIEACERLMAVRDEEVARITAEYGRGTTNAQSTGSATGDEEGTR
ncbi:CDP-glycerol glycerophosphotransferase family protein [Isoptericola sp. NEAU-Y5]|uniref:CDP-glycerol glycerophosphotransferase family protein n=1 Tax=Isoptericola luteus TaxID=2879484 RepID=A0ABS7ZG13_9MICO|nr:CDP-glycerol glycerophosphotransferase family protein [Isoptericola sp. NEAU-Y5]MCA5892745.1 CDP-glycerol glycerophosphotransferase family protein [Isoptericola sp. NEAU-Y5]